MSDSYQTRSERLAYHLGMARLLAQRGHGSLARWHQQLAEELQQPTT